MQFHVYPNRTKGKDIKDLLELNADDAYRVLALTMVHLWAQRKQPYIRVWPSIVEPLCKLDISKIKMSMLHFPEVVISLQFAVGHEFEGIKSCLVAVGPESFAIHLEDSRMCFMRLDENETIGEVYDRYESRDMNLRKLVQLACACALLSPDDLIPEMLTKDKDKELTKARINKAIQRGKYGWSLGCIPHVRRPHPCLVWTGEGKKIPKIIIRKGSVVKRDRVLIVEKET